ncbi:hypothetical protein FA15DRAFT_233718 [Coprinopsis marcescibilis]|uniref:F-box domain-containing protein n=1 Tax=Coprinopsis marcescibilis TaxID=230819 RepID=A0A5C3KSY3_COPMA|nr:hypothetical protein FA15DRAFT_233718 [Coprinopsis marcescibilis]
MPIFKLQLPTELIHRIINYLSMDEESLRTASLTSHRFRDICQQLLFSGLHLQRPWSSDPESNLPGTKLLSLLQGSPRIAGYIREVSMDGGYTDDEEESWMALDMCLSPALGLIPTNNIKRLAVLHVRWEDLPSALQQAISAFFQSSSLVSLDISEVPLQLLDLCGPSLNQLHTYTLTDHKEACSPPATNSTPTSGFDLHTLTLRSSTAGPPRPEISYLLDDSSKARITSLRKLRLMFSDKTHYHAAQALISAAASTLQSILVAQSISRDDDTLMDLSGLLKLQRVSTRGLVTELDHPSIAMAKLIGPLSASIPLEHIHICACYRSTPTWNSEPWLSLDSLITDNHKHQFQTLKVVEIEIVSSHGVGEELVARVEDALTYIKGAGLLNIRLNTGSKGMHIGEPF